jgi:hypothetical protein
VVRHAALKVHREGLFVAPSAPPVLKMYALVTVRPMNVT